MRLQNEVLKFDAGAMPWPACPVELGATSLVDHEPVAAAEGGGQANYHAEAVP